MCWTDEWKPRDAIKRVNQTLAELKVEQHPEKTFIGRICRGFEFLGYRIHPGRLGVAKKTAERFAERVTRLYEQGAGVYRIGEYVRRWWIWVKSGLRHFLAMFAVPLYASEFIPCPNTRPRRDANQ